MGRAKLIGIIAAVSPDGVIGLDGKIPWHYPGDLARFKEITLGATVVMGRLTWESIGKALPGRRNIVLTKYAVNGSPDYKGPDVEDFPSISAALRACRGDVWFIGGSRVYAEAMPYCSVLDITYVPDRPRGPTAVYFPTVSFEDWDIGPFSRHSHDPYLFHRTYHRLHASLVS